MEEQRRRDLEEREIRILTEAVPLISTSWLNRDETLRQIVHLCTDVGADLLPWRRLDMTILRLLLDLHSRGVDFHPVIDGVRRDVLRRIADRLRFETATGFAARNGKTTEDDRRRALRRVKTKAIERKLARREDEALELAYASAL